MTYGWRAAIAESQPWDLAVTLHVWKPGTDGRSLLLGDGGTIYTVEEGVVPPAETGLKIPREALGAIAEAFHPHATGQARLEGELRATKEALGLERERVEAIINKALES